MADRGLRWETLVRQEDQPNFRKEANKGPEPVHFGLVSGLGSQCEDENPSLTCIRDKNRIWQKMYFEVGSIGSNLVGNKLPSPASTDTRSQIARDRSSGNSNSARFHSS